VIRAAAACLTLTAAAFAGAPAHAGEATCWYENGAIVVSAAAGPIADDFILDLSAPRSQLHLTRAQGMGIDADDVTVPLRVAGERIAAVDFEVANLNAQTWGFPTNVSGVIGADVLRRYVVDIQFSPCRIALWPRRAPRFKADLILPLRWVAGAPALRAAASDGTAGLAGWYALDTASAGVRIADRRASLSRTPAKGVDLASRAVPPARLRALSIGATMFENLPAGLQADAPSGLAGSVGNAVWA
jgi:hypothetical protein